MENNKIKCPQCGKEINVYVKEFVDVSVNPEYREQILNGTFFLAVCPECGSETLMEYPIMYIDSDKKLNIYMAPEHEDDLLDQLNSLEIPYGEEEKDAIFRVTSGCDELLEKILIAEGGRDDRIIELYKLIMAESLGEEIPGIHSSQFLYYKDDAEELFIVFGYENEEEDQLTVPFDEELYRSLEQDYIDDLEIPANQYAEVNSKWMEERIDFDA